MVVKRFSLYLPSNIKEQSPWGSYSRQQMCGGEHGYNISGKYVTQDNFLVLIFEALKTALLNSTTENTEIKLR